MRSYAFWDSVLIILIIMATAMLSFVVIGDYYEVKAVEAGHAQYNRTTGDWEWKTEEEGGTE